MVSISGIDVKFGRIIGLASFVAVLVYLYVTYGSGSPATGEVPLQLPAGVDFSGSGKANSADQPTQKEYVADKQGESINIDAQEKNKKLEVSTLYS